jgi:hypothetical protein
MESTTGNENGPARRFRSALAHALPYLVIVVGLALSAPAMTGDFTGDDHIQRVFQRTDLDVPGLHSTTLDLFNFIRGDRDDTAHLRDAGFFSWWTDPAIRMAFWRPITSATHALDHLLWPDSAAAQLAHNLVWLALALLAVWACYRRLFTARWIAVLALALYAFDDARGAAVSWIANRNALVTLALALPVLVIHDRWRRDGWAAGRWLGPAVFALALVAGEPSLAVLAYIAAHALWLDRAPWRSRLLAIAPYLLIVLAWRVLYIKLGYGNVGSGTYLDPGAQPSAFLSAAMTRIPFMLVGQLALPWSDSANLYDVLGITGLMLAIGLVTLAAIGLACTRLLRRDPVARFFATGMVLAAVPVASTFPSDRLLSFVGVGGMGLVAQLLSAALRHRDQLGDGRLRRAACVAVALVMVLVHLVIAPPLLVVRSRSMIAIARMIDRADAGVPRGGNVIIAGAPSELLTSYVQYMRLSRREPRPDHLYWLATLTTAVTLERLDARTLRVTPEGGYLRYKVDRLMRVRPFTLGERIALTGLEIEIESLTADGRAQSILVHFTQDPESFTWLRWEGRTYVPYTPPAVGAREVLPAVDLVQLFLD